MPGGFSDLLTRSSALNRNMYRSRSVTEWCKAIHRWLKSEDQPAPLDALEKLAAPALLKGCRQDRVADCPTHPFFDAVVPFLQLQRQWQTLADEQGLMLSYRWSEHLQKTLPERKAQAAVWGFDDLLKELHGALVRSGGAALAGRIAEQFPVVLVDEFQDTDPLQYQIFRRIWGKQGLFLIGDPKQAIYSFRGADIFAYLDAVKETPAGKRYTMTTNWRSDPAVLKALEHLFRRLPYPFFSKAIGYPAVAPRPWGKGCFGAGWEPTESGPTGVVCQASRAQQMDAAGDQGAAAKSARQPFGRAIGRFDAATP